MNIGATGIVIDHYGDVLMIQRDDTRTLAPPGGSAEIGELPSDTVAREVGEETGLIVMPVRLVGLFFLPAKPDDYLSFCYRCIIRGGNIQTSNEALKAGFFKTNPLPKSMLGIHKERVIQSVAHQGGPPVLKRHDTPLRVRLGTYALNYIIYPWMHLRRRLKGQPPYQPPPQWNVQNYLILQNTQDQVLWVKSQQEEEWVLPRKASVLHEAPWETAASVLENTSPINPQSLRLGGIYPAAASPSIALTFVNRVNTELQQLASKNANAFFTMGEEPSNVRTEHANWVSEAFQNLDEVHSRFLETETNIY